MTTTFEFASASPANDATLVQDDAALTGQIQSSSPLLSVLITLNGERVVSSDGFEKPEWAYPNYEGRIHVVNQRFGYVIRHRRRFDPDTKYTLSFEFEHSEGDTFATTTVSLDFTTETRQSPISVADREPGVLDSRIEPVALNSLRVYLLGSLATRIGSPPAAALLRHRVSRCSLVSLLSPDQRETPLLPEDIASVVTVASVIDGLQPFWEASLQEARRLGLPEPTLELLAKTMKAPYPQERVGAAAALLLSVAKYL